jgi:hypothetical protein
MQADTAQKGESICKGRHLKAKTRRYLHQSLQYLPLGCSSGYIGPFTVSHNHTSQLPKVAGSGIAF